MIFLFFGSSINTYGNHMATIPRHFLPNKKKAKTLFDYDTLGTPGSPSFSDEIVRLETRRTFSTQPTFLWNTKQPIFAMRGAYLLSQFDSFSSKTRILLPLWKMSPVFHYNTPPHRSTQINTDYQLQRFPTHSLLSLWHPVAKVWISLASIWEGESTPVHCHTFLHCMGTCTFHPAAQIFHRF